MARNYAALPHAYLEEMDALSDAEFGRLCRSLLQFSMSGQKSSLSGPERLFLNRIYMQELRFQQNYDEIVSARRAAGKKGAEKRWHNSSDDGKAMANYSKNSETETKIETETESEIKTESKTETNNPPPDGGEVLPRACADWGFGSELHQTFLDWLAYKKERRQGYTPTGLKNLLNQVRKNTALYGEEAVSELIRQCMSSNWQGIIWAMLGQKTGVPKCGEGGRTWMELAEQLDQEEEFL